MTIWQSHLQKQAPTDWITCPEASTFLWNLPTWIQEWSGLFRSGQMWGNLWTEVFTDQISWPSDPRGGCTNIAFILLVLDLMPTGYFQFTLYSIPYTFTWLIASCSVFPQQALSIVVQCTALLGNNGISIFIKLSMPSKCVIFNVE